MELNSTDRQQLSEKGISESTLKQQLDIFKSGAEPASLVRACTIGDGIQRLSPDEVYTFAGQYDSATKDLRVLKFVPASGAASRMFKHLHNYDPQDPGELNSEFLDRFDELPFSDILDPENKLSPEERIKLTIDAKGLGYALVPKGMVLFHRYDEVAKTAFEEHLAEGLLYADRDGVNIHFTVPEGQEEKIGNFLSEKAGQYGGSRFNLTFSNQQAFTDTVAVTLDNEPYRDDYGRLLFRPGGHGALIHNLNDNPSDLIFIKNIDNVVHESRIEETVVWKKVLGGVLINLKEKIHGYLNAFENGSADAAQEMELRKLLNLGEMSTEELVELLKAPIRVCGMVKNEGEPGGGPFWVDGNHFPQVVESAQISSAPDQQEIVAAATHFNPTDLVCCTTDHRGEAYNLLDFVDHSACFISEKSIAGTAVKALELPGLWNGAMAKWISVFVEVPLETFNPVKTVNDLLRPVHQPK